MDDQSIDFHRLGKQDLGRHANEDRMQEKVASLLAHEDESNGLYGVITKLAELLEHDQEVEVAYLCTSAAVQINKLDNEGPYFCGYRNMQMLCLALGRSGVAVAGELDLRQKLTIPQLQAMVEKAWDQGLNSHGRIQTGGIAGTRKYVGASEAEALLLSLAIPCTGTAFKGKHAWLELLDFVQTYFSQDVIKAQDRKGVRQTTRLPIFLQRPKHSITIIGLERLRSGSRRILVFDPAWHPPSAMEASVADGKLSKWKRYMLLSRYRKSERYLKRFAAFETLTVD